MQSHIARLRIVAALKGAPIALRSLSPPIVHVSGPEGESWGYYVTDALLEVLSALPDAGNLEAPEAEAQRSAQEAVVAAGRQACLGCGDANWEGLGVLCDRCARACEDEPSGRLSFPPSEAAPGQAVAVRMAGVA